MKIILILFFVCLAACQSTAEKNTKEQTGYKKDSIFSLYLQNFKKIGLPVVVKACKTNPEKLILLDKKEFSDYTGGFAWAYGQIPANGNYVVLITLSAADCYLPVVTTFRPDGRKIAQETIAIGGCGSDCGFECEEFMTLRKDHTFYTSDTVSTYACDSLGREIPDTYQYYVTYRKGRILADGRIEMTEETKQPLLGRKNKP